MRQIVIPGDELPDGRPGKNVYTMDGKNFSSVVGIVNQVNGYVNVVPLKGVYNPKPGIV